MVFCVYAVVYLENSSGEGGGGGGGGLRFQELRRATQYVMGILC